MRPVITIVISDPELISKLAAADGQIVILSAAGDHIRTVEPIALGTPAEYKCPFTEEELDKFSKERNGRSLSAILEDLQKLST